MNTPETIEPVRASTAACDVDRFVLVVMENASEWPSHVKGGPAGCVVLKQEPEETHADLLRRTNGRVRAIERTGAGIEAVVLSCNDDATAGAVEGRRPLAQALLATVLHGRDGKLELMARASASLPTKASLTTLARALFETIAGTSASVSARFEGGSSTEPSGVDLARSVAFA